MCLEKSPIETAESIDIKKQSIRYTLVLNMKSLFSLLSLLVFTVYHIYRITQSSYSYIFSSGINSTPSSTCASKPLREINAYR